MGMEFVETTLFTKRLYEVLTEAEYAALQDTLIERPDAGDIIQGTGGLRKIRVGHATKGKRGGARVIYYWITADYKIYLMAIYTKNQQADLTPRQKQLLSDAIKEFK